MTQMILNARFHFQGFAFFSFTFNL